MFRKLREALKSSATVSTVTMLPLPEVHTGQIAHSDAPETPEKHKSINYESVAIPEVHIPKKKALKPSPPGGEGPPQGRMRGELAWLPANGLPQRVRPSSVTFQ